MKFRAWHFKQKKMYSCEELVNDQMTILADGRFANINGFSPLLSVIYPLDVLLPLQSTEEVDIDGREIFVGDVISLGRKNGHVIFRNGCYYISTYDFEYAIFEMDYLKIIGNIYENPEFI